MKYENGVKCKGCGNLKFEIRQYYPCQECGINNWEDVVVETKSASKWWNPGTWGHRLLKEIEKENKEKDLGE